MIEVRDLFKTFGKIDALQGVNTSFSSHAVTALVGPNACGKTTLVKTILGLVIPDKGDVRIEGSSILRDHHYRKDIGYAPQDPDFPKNLCGRELLSMIEEVRGEKSRFIRDLLDRFELGAALSQRLGTLSGGTRQKLGLAIAFMFEPKILVLDEPSVGLDPLSNLQLKDLVQGAVKKGQAVILVSHIMSEIEAMATSMKFMAEGRIVFEGEIAEILKKSGSDSLEQAVIRFLQNSDGRQRFRGVGA